MFNVIAPCLVLSLTILFGFFFPPESGERISFIITILLAIAVFMQMISGTLPVNSDGVPKLALFYMVILIESALSLGKISTLLLLLYSIYFSTIEKLFSFDGRVWDKDTTKVKKEVRALEKISNW